MADADWVARLAPVGDDPALSGERMFARLFDPVSGIPDAALVVAEASAYLVRPGETPRLVHAADDVELLFGALAGQEHARSPGEWRAIPDDVPLSLLATSTWVVATAGLKRAPPAATP